MKPLILITNDDGIYSPGLHALAEVALMLGDIVICAPLEQQTSMSCAKPRPASRPRCFGDGAGAQYHCLRQYGGVVNAWCMLSPADFANARKMICVDLRDLQMKSRLCMSAASLR